MIDRPPSGRGGPRLPLTGERTVPGVPQENYWFRRHEAAYAFAAELAAGAGAVLDLGAGEGYGAAMLADAGARVTAMELEEAVAAHASRRYGSRIGMLRADACRVPFRPNAFGAVVAMQVVEHLWCPHEFIAGVRRVLRPGGAFICSTPNRETFSPSGVRNPFHTHEFTAAELEGLLRTAFSDVEVRGVRHGLFLRSLDVLAAGSLQHLLMDTPYGELPAKLRIGVGLVRARHFAIGHTDGALDLLAIAR